MDNGIDFSKTNNPMPWRVLLSAGFALLGSAGAWVLHLNLTYFLVQPVCVMGGEFALHASGLVSMLIALASVGTAISLIRSNPSPFRQNVEGSEGWLSFVGLFGITVGALFMLAISTQWAPVFVIDACMKVWT